MKDTADTRTVTQVRPAGPAPAEIAAMILAGFNRHYALFRYGAQRAKALFESGDWHGIAQLSRERIEYYDMRVRECINLVQKALKHASLELPEDFAKP